MVAGKSESKFVGFNKFKGVRRRRKKEVVFDEEKRKEFLTGFRKRKMERKKKAEKQLQEELKEEKKRLKQEARDRYKQLLHKRPEIDIEEFLKKNEYETKNHKVSILELDVASLDKSHIGQNNVTYEEENPEKEVSEAESSSDNDSEISGFEMEPKKKKKKKPKGEQVPTEIAVPGSKKELKKTLKVAAMQELQKSKAFQRKKLIEKQKNKRASKLEKLRKSKSKKGSKGKKGKKK